MTRRIGGAGGGSDKGSGGGAVVAAVLAGAIAVSGAATGAGASTATSAASALDSAAVQRIHVNTTKAKKPARNGHEDEAWRRMALRPIKNPSVRRALQCVADSYGQVREFFIHTPCRSLHRRLLALADEQGNVIVVSIAWVRMPSTGSARRFRQLIDTYGTGDVSPLAGELLGLGGIRFTGQHYDSRKARTLVVIAETEPAIGQPHPELLNGIAQVATQLPPPS